MSLQEVETKLGVQLPDDVLAEVALDEERLVALEVNEMSEEAWAGLCTSYPEIQAAINRCTDNKVVAAVLSEDTLAIEKIIFQFKRSFRKRELLKIAKDTNRFWGFRRHFEEPELLKDWFRGFLVGDYLRGTLWSVEYQNKVMLSEIDCRSELLGDRWIVFETGIKPPKEDTKKTEATATTTTGTATSPTVGASGATQSSAAVGASSDSCPNDGAAAAGNDTGGSVGSDEPKGTTAAGTSAEAESEATAKASETTTAVGNTLKKNQ